MTDRLLILGAGGHGKVVADAALMETRWMEIAFLDAKPPAQSVIGLPVLGGLGPTDELRQRFTHAIVAIGNARRRLELLKELTDCGFVAATIKHPASVISAHSHVGGGSVLFANSTVNAGSRLGNGCIINTNAVVDHDCTLGDGVHVAPGAAIAGHVSIARASWIGIGASVCQGVNIGANVSVGAGAVVTDDVADGLTVVGVPARPMATQG